VYPRGFSQSLQVNAETVSSFPTGLIFSITREAYSIVPQTSTLPRASIYNDNECVMQYNLRHNSTYNVTKHEVVMFSYVLNLHW
jgi:hypothetical protein